MISFELFSLFVVVTLVGLFINQIALRRVLVANKESAARAIMSVRRQLIVNRQVTPSVRKTLRNREVSALGRDIDGEVPVNDEIEIVDEDVTFRDFVERGGDVKARSSD